MSSPVASTSGHGNPRKRPRARAVAALPGRHESSSRTSDITTSSSPPITTAKRVVVNNNNKSVSLLSPPTWTSDEDEVDELAGPSDVESSLSSSDGEALLGSRERKNRAMKKLRHARKEKEKRPIFYSPLNKGKSKSKSSGDLSSRYLGYESDELASDDDGSSSGKLSTDVPMPWEEEDQGLSGRLLDKPDKGKERAVEEVYDAAQAEEGSIAHDPDLPPPLNHVHVWKRKARPPSRTDLFISSQWPATQAHAPSPPRLKDKASTSPKKSRGNRSARLSPVRAEQSSTSRSETKELSLLDILREEKSQARDGNPAILEEIDEPMPVSRENSPLPPPLLKSSSSQRASSSNISRSHSPHRTKESLPIDDLGLPEADPRPVDDDDVGYGDMQELPFWEPMDDDYNDVGPPQDYALPEPDPPAQRPEQLGEVGQAKTSSVSAVSKSSPAKEPSLPPPVGNVNSKHPLSSPGKLESIQQHDSESPPRSIPSKVSLPEMSNPAKPNISASRPVSAASSESTIKGDMVSVPHGVPVSSPVARKVAAVPSSNKDAPPSDATSDEECQPCPFCGNIYPLSALPIHAEACSEEQEAAAAGSPSPKKHSPEMTSQQLRAPSSRSTAKSSQVSSAKQPSVPTPGKTNDAALEAMLFGDDPVPRKARQTASSPQRSSQASKGRGSALGIIGNCTSNIPVAGPSGRKRHLNVVDIHDDDDHTAGDAIEIDDSSQDTSKAAKRLKTLRGPPVPHAAPAARQSTWNRDDVGDSPPRGSIFVSKLPRDVRLGYYSLAGLNADGTIETVAPSKLVLKPNKAAEMAGWAGLRQEKVTRKAPAVGKSWPGRGRGRGRGGFRGSVRRKR